MSPCVPTPTDFQDNATIIKLIRRNTISRSWRNKARLHEDKTEAEENVKSVDTLCLSATKYQDPAVSHPRHFQPVFPHLISLHRNYTHGICVQIKAISEPEFQLLSSTLPSLCYSQYFVLLLLLVSYSFSCALYATVIAVISHNLQGECYYIN